MNMLHRMLNHSTPQAVRLHSQFAAGILMAMPMLALWAAVFIPWFPGYVHPYHPGIDMSNPWLAIHRFWFNPSHVYIHQVQSFTPEAQYPAPFLVLLGPISLLNVNVVVHLAGLASIVCLIWIILVFARNDAQGYPWFIVVVGASVVTYQVIELGQFGTVLGVVGFGAGLILARDRHWLASGVLLAVGTLRLANAVPILCGLAVHLLIHRQYKELLRIVLGGTAVLLPAILVVSLKYPHWPSEYITVVSQYDRLGILAPAAAILGHWGVPLMSAIGGLLCGFILRKSLSTDRIAMVLAISALFTPFAAVYPAAFAFPAIARFGAQAQKRGAFNMFLLILLPWGVVPMALLLHSLALALILPPVIQWCIIIVLAIALAKYSRRSSPIGSLQHMHHQTPA